MVGLGEQQLCAVYNQDCHDLLVFRETTGVARAEPPHSSVEREHAPPGAQVEGCWGYLLLGQPHAAEQVAVARQAQRCLGKDDSGVSGLGFAMLGRAHHHQQ